ncbi:MAG: rhodanese-like domain-containing protein [Pseudomonadota bacterium]
MSVNISVRPRWLATIGVIMAAAASIALVAAGRADKALDDVHADVVRDYPGVSHLSATALAGGAGASDTVLFDVRRPDEFAVSHLANAIRVAPGMSADDFLRAHGDRIAGKRVVFYCSVGVRSSKLAERVQAALLDRAAQRPAAVHNLAKGIFGWRNSNRPLATPAAQPTDKVHPYNAYWGRLITDRSAIQYSPKL